MRALPDDVLARFSSDDVAAIAEEASRDPRFGRWVTGTVRAGGAGAVALSARKAVANEFDPSLYPETRGAWPALRRKALAMARHAAQEIARLIDAMPFEAKMRVVGAIGRPVAVIPVGVSGLGQYDVVGGVAEAVSSIYGAKVTAGAQRDITRIQAQADARDLQAQARIEAAQRAINQARSRMGGAAGLPASIGGAPTLIVVSVALGVLGLVLYLFFRRG